MAPRKIGTRNPAHQPSALSFSPVETESSRGGLGEVPPDRNPQFGASLKLALDQASEVILITEAEPVSDPGPRIVYVNRAFERVTGYSASEVLGKTPRILQGPKTNKEALDRIHRALASWRPVREELINYRKDGSEFAMELSISPVCDDKGWYIHWFAVQRDTTSLYLARERLRLAQNAAGMGTFECHYPFGRLSFDSRARRILGLSVSGEATTLRQFLRRVPVGDRGSVLEQLRRVREAEPIHLAFPIVSNLFVSDSRHAIWIEVSGSVIPLQPENRLVYLGAVMDITARREAEERLLTSQATLRSLARRLHTVTERERMRMARELHDQLGQTLTALKMDLDWIRRKQGRNGELSVTLLGNAMKVVDSTIGLVRTLSTELRPEMLEVLGLSAAIKWCATEFERRFGIHCVANVPAELLSLSEEHKIAVFRILQEALTNVARHAKAHNVTISLLREQHCAELLIQDDGVGSNTSELEHPTSLGMLGMRERAQMLGGAMAIETSPGHGFRIKLHFPLDNQKPDEPTS